MHHLGLPALLTLALALTGCGGSAPTPPTAPAGPAVPAATGAPAAGDGPTAQDVVDDFAAAGLAVPKARDNTATNCGSLGCTQLITTDALSVVRFDNPAVQQRYVAGFGDDAYAEGPIVLQYAAARTPAGKRAAYEKRLRAFLAEPG